MEENYAGCLLSTLGSVGGFLGSAATIIYCYSFSWSDLTQNQRDGFSLAISFIPLMVGIGLGIGGHQFGTYLHERKEDNLSKTLNQGELEKDLNEAKNL